MNKNNKGFRNLEVERWGSLYETNSKENWAIFSSSALKRIKMRKELCLNWLAVQKGESI